MSGPHDHTHNITINDVNAQAMRLYGQPYVSSTLVPPGKMYSLGGVIHGRPEDMDRLLHQQFSNDIVSNPPTPKAPMSTIDKIKAERREKREREELEAKFHAWDIVFASDYADVGFFVRTINDKSYRYAVINADERWFLTGAETCGMAVEDLIAWLIAKEVDPEEFRWLKAVEL